MLDLDETLVHYFEVRETNVDPRGRALLGETRRRAVSVGNEQNIRTGDIHSSDARCKKG